MAEKRKYVSEMTSLVVKSGVCTLFILLGVLLFVSVGFAADAAGSDTENGISLSDGKKVDFSSMVDYARPHAEDRIFIKYAAGSTSKVSWEILREFSDELCLVKIPRGMTFKQAVAYLESFGGIEYIEPDYQDISALNPTAVPSSASSPFPFAGIIAGMLAVGAVFVPERK